MPFRNTQQTFGFVAKTFHWVMALLIIFLICLGYYMSDLEIGPDLFKKYALHKSLGITVLILAFIRVGWRMYSSHPEAIPTHKKWERTLSGIVHFMLYSAFFIMPISGWLMSSAKGFSVSVFSFFTLPDLIKPNEQMAGILQDVHETSAIILIAIIGLHVAGALKHHVIDKDETLKRMLPCFKCKKQGN